MHTEELRARYTQVLAHAKERWSGNEKASPADIVDSLPDELGRVIGGETTCAEVRFGNEQLIIDMGTGARRLGYDMLARGHKGDVHVLITHTHWDHIQGWPFFVPGFIPGNTVHFHSCHTACRERFVRQQQHEFFPVDFEEMRSIRIFHQYQAGESFQIGSFTIDTAGLVHPGGATAYRIRAGGKTFVFATDTEFFGPTLEQDMAARKPFFEGADLAVLDAQYSLKEAEQKIGWGHTAMVIAVDCAISWNVKKAVLTHHEPAHTDQRIRELYGEAMQHLKEKDPAPPVIFELAVEDKIYEV